MKLATIRRAQLWDAARIQKVFADECRATPKKWFRPRPQPPTTAEILLWLASDRVWVATMGADVVGVIRMRAGNSQFPTLLKLAILSHLKSSGVGKLLMDAVEKDARVRGCLGVTLVVPKNQVPLSRAFAARGYSAVNARTIQKIARNEILMRKTF